MSDVEYTKCPGLECPNKVVVHKGRFINFCCANCWEFSWAHTQVAWGVTDDEAPKLLKHTSQCVVRQQLRLKASYRPDDGTEYVLAVSMPNVGPRHA